MATRGEGHTGTAGVGVDGPAGVELTAGAVARMLGVAPSTLRSWARRYGLGPPDHESGRYRRYSERDVTELRVMCRLVGQGVAPAAAAALAREHTSGGADTSGAGTGEEPEGGRRSQARVVAGLVGAAERLDADAVATTVGRHLAERGVVATWQQVCRPTLAALDRQVAETGGGQIHAQLVAAWAFSTALRPISAAADATSDATTGASVLLACTEEEQHTLALEALHAALVEAHVPTRMLGPSAPLVALDEACRRTHPDTAVLWAQTPETARPEVLAEVSRAAGAVLALGPGWSGLDLAGLPANVDTLDDLPAVLRYIADRFEGHPQPR